MTNKYGKEESIKDYLHDMTDRIDNAKGKVAGWMRPCMISYTRRNFPLATHEEIMQAISEFCGDATPIY